MKSLKWIIPKVLILLLIFFTFFQKVDGASLNNIIYYNCGKKVSPKTDALAGDFQAAIEEILNRIKGCLPQILYENLMQSLKSRTALYIYIDCKENCPCFLPPDGCGGTPQTDLLGSFPVGFFIMLNYENIYMNGECGGCPDASILHELLHWGGGLRGGNPTDSHEKVAYGCEEKCFPDCAKNRKGYSPADCCDQEKSKK